MPDEPWSAVEAALRDANPLLLEGLRPPATRDAIVWLEAAGVPPEWMALWAGHDGQTPRIGGLFDGWTFLPVLGDGHSVASTREALRLAGQAGLPVAVDHSGETLLLGPHGLVATDGTWPRHRTASDLLAAVARQIRRDPPRLWSRRADARWHPSAEVELTVMDPASLPIGVPQPLGHGLVWVRLDAEALSAPWAPVIRFAHRDHDLPFALDADAPDAAGQLTRVHLRWSGEARAVSAASRGDHHWLSADDGRLHDLELVLTVELDRPLAGPRPLTGSTSSNADTRCTALRLLGDRAGALATKEAAGKVDAERVGLLLATGDVAQALSVAAQLKSDPVVALLVAEARAAQGDAGLLDTLVADRRRAHTSLIRAQVREQRGDLTGAVADTRTALTRLSFLEEGARGRIRCWLERRQAALRAVPSAPAEVLIAADLPEPAGVAEQDGAHYRVTVVRTPDQAAAGGSVAVTTPAGPVGVVLPPGAGHGATLRLKHIGPDNDGDLIVTVALRLPPTWRPADGAINDGLQFERWDVVADLDPVHAGVPVQVAGLDGVHALTAPAPGEELRIAGGGLPRPRGTRGAFIVRCGHTAG